MSDQRQVDNPTDHEATSEALWKTVLGEAEKAVPPMYAYLFTSEIPPRDSYKNGNGESDPNAKQIPISTHGGLMTLSRANYYGDDLNVLGKGHADATSHQPYSIIKVVFEPGPGTSDVVREELMITTPRREQAQGDVIFRTIRSIEPYGLDYDPSHPQFGPTRKKYLRKIASESRAVLKAPKNHQATA